MRPKIKNLLFDTADVIFPRECAACRISLNRGEYLLCTTCTYHLPKSHTWKEKDNYVARLFWGRVYLENAASFLLFQKGSKVQEIMHQFKYRNQREIGYHLGAAFASEIKNTEFQEVDFLLPVPLHANKERKRGYNQSECIAQGISSVMKKPVLTNVLKRIIANESQTSKHKYDRWMNVDRIFELQHSELIANKHVLLIDDVLTTGATIESCAQELLNVPGTKLSVITLAVAV